MSLFAIQDDLRKSVDKQQLQQWLKIDSKRAYRDLIVDWLGIVLALAAVSLCQSWYTFVLAFFAIGFCQYALFILGHDALHGSFLHDRKMNDGIARWLIYGPMLMGFDDGKRNHLEHHKLLGSSIDPDRYLHTLSNKNSRLDFFLFLIGAKTFWKTVLKVTPFGKMLQAREGAKISAPTGDAGAGAKVAAEATVSRESVESSVPKNTELGADDQVQSPNSSGVPVSVLLTQYIKQRLPVFVWQPVLIGSMFLLGLPWWSYLVLWIAPIYVCVFCADEIRAFCDHAVPMMPDDKADDMRLVTYVPSFIEATVFSPHNMNYHAEHHLWPKLPYYNRPMAHAAIKSRREITVRNSYVAFLIRLTGALPLGENESANLKESNFKKSSSKESATGTTRKDAVNDEKTAENGSGALWSLPF
ncbi:MAG TPA: hypothetical protein EYN91_26230 [Candidatus Melainabacteria bacterium]|jgi:fatty acid desaturase|nr:hypothetical protein [Candidatus Melainabacteria bacterium]HIN66468.1 hypothetical protein [Candidatus Obscuribacterales bacterium]